MPNSFADTAKATARFWLPHQGLCKLCAHILLGSVVQSYYVIQSVYTCTAFVAIHAHIHLDTTDMYLWCTHCAWIQHTSAYIYLSPVLRLCTQLHFTTVHLQA